MSNGLSFKSTNLNIFGKKILLTRKKVKTLRMIINPKNLEIKLTVPEHISMQEIKGFIEKNLNWIEENQKRLLIRKRKLTNLKTLKMIRFFGKEIPLNLKISSRFSYNFYENIVEIRVRDFSDAEISRCINLFYKKELAFFIEKIQKDCENLTGEKITSINYRAMKTKLGSCKPSERKITLNTRLIEYREECIEMVLIHEIIHFKEFYHNARFKALMTKYCPNWKSLRRQMKQVDL